ncbi:MAG: hypothetical protein M1824_000576 [Vezdaea acicularis]|nr:MAG: hypothetical protein M1824_000576 [Vezdaea acicularis]
MAVDEENLPFWCVNLPRESWPDKCPDFLKNVSDKDRGIISTRDEDYHRQTWPEVKDIISRNRIDLFQRVPSDLRRYRAYTWSLTQQYGSVMNFVQNERLHWKDLAPRSSTPFGDPEDIKILWNDWPYGVDEKIVHLVIWTKFDLESDPITDDLTPKARAEIDNFVDKTFRREVPPENLIWFKNWTSLKSIHAVEHFHVMLYDPDPTFVAKITNNDVPLSKRALQLP